MEVIVNGIYRHFKGNMYKVLLVAKDSENLKQLVIYQDINDETKIWARDYDMFISKVDKLKYPDIKQQYRFELVKNK